jgi:hypothetical protein
MPATKYWCRRRERVSNSRVCYFMTIPFLLLKRLRARSLLEPTDGVGSMPCLSSGLYIVRANAMMGASDERHYVIYWPEDSTWNDSASSSVRRNRVTFMR